MMNKIIDIIFEKEKTYYLKKYKIDRKTWEINRIIPSIVLSIVLFIVLTIINVPMQPDKLIVNEVNSTFDEQNTPEYEYNIRISEMQVQITEKNIDYLKKYKMSSRDTQMISNKSIGEKVVLEEQSVDVSQEEYEQLNFKINAIRKTTQIKKIMLSLVVFLIMFKNGYTTLKNIDKQIDKYLAIRLPMITTTIVALSSYYDSVVNIIEYSKEYVEDKYYTIKVDEFLLKVKNNPDETDKHIFDLFANLPSVNSLFLARAIVDIKNKGYDQELLLSLIKSVNEESDSTIKKILEVIPLQFIKFGTFPIMLTMLIMMYMVMALMTYIFM